VYVIGKTGTGKSTLLEGMALQDLANGNGFALIDPLGDLAEHVASRIPRSRQDDLIYLNAADVNQPWGYNPLRRVAPQYIALAASGFMEVFKKMWPDAWGVHPASAFDPTPSYTSIRGDNGRLMSSEWSSIVSTLAEHDSSNGAPKTPH
jgi:hypothetical protein